MPKNRSEEDSKQNGLVDRITSFLNKRIILTVLIALFIAISFSYPVVGEVSTISIDTDSSWKCLDAMVDGWTSVDFDDSYWENAKLLDATDAIGYEPQGLEQNVIWYPEEPMSHTSYFRKAFTINGNVIGGKVLIGDDGNTDWYLYVNGKFVGKSGFFSGVSEFDIGSYLKSGQNVIAVRAEWNKWGIPCWGLFGTVRTTPAPTSTPSSSDQQTPTPTPIQIPTPVVSPIPSEYTTPTLKPGEPYVHLYGHKTDVTIGEEVILYLSVINPITSHGTLKVQLTLQVPSGWSITSGEFSPPVGGFQTAVYDIEQGPDTKTIGIHMLANQPFDGLITGYTDYYFVEQPETKYHKEVNEPVTAKQTEPSPSAPSLPSVTPNGGMGTEVKSVIIAIIVATIGSVLARAIWSSIKKRREY